MPTAIPKREEPSWATVASAQRRSVRTHLASPSKLLPPKEEVEALIAPVRTFLCNAAEIDFTGAPQVPFDDATEFLADTYGDRLLTLHKIPGSRKLQLGFTEDVELKEILENPPILHGYPLPTTKAYALTDDLVSVTLRKVAFPSVEALLENIHKIYTPLARLLDVQLHYWGKTDILKPAITIFLDKSKDPSLLHKLPRRPMICGQPAFAYWRDAPPLCAYCGKEGHDVKRCLAKRYTHSPPSYTNKPPPPPPPPNDPPATPPVGRKRSRRRSPSQSPSRAQATSSSQEPAAWIAQPPKVQPQNKEIMDEEADAPSDNKTETKTLKALDAPKSPGIKDPKSPVSIERTAHIESENLTPMTPDDEPKSTSTPAPQASSIIDSIVPPNTSPYKFTFVGRGPYGMFPSMAALSKHILSTIASQSAEQQAHFHIDQTLK
ncbi:MAG: hypothetical protein DHS80DRAFT_22774, partial [Piptocephalis tieghemiana]